MKNIARALAFSLVAVTAVLKCNISDDLRIRIHIELNLCRARPPRFIFMMYRCHYDSLSFKFRDFNLKIFFDRFFILNQNKHCGNLGAYPHYLGIQL